MKQKLFTLLVVPVLALGCGGGDGPTTPTPRAFAYETVSESSIAAHTTFCTNFRQEASGEVYAHAGLPVPIEMGAGSCAGTRSVVARGDRGEVTAALAVGDSFVRFENTSDTDARFRLTLRYLRLY
jgi:hypothetical protein